MLVGLIINEKLPWDENMLVLSRVVGISSFGATSAEQASRSYEKLRSHVRVQSRTRRQTSIQRLLLSGPPLPSAPFLLPAVGSGSKGQMLCVNTRGLDDFLRTAKDPRELDGGDNEQDASPALGSGKASTETTAC